MADFLSPGVFITRTTTAQTVPQSISASTSAFTGFTVRGRTDEPFLVENFTQFLEEAGGYTSQSIMPLAIQAAFANQANRIYINRVIPSDAIVSNGSLQSKTTNQQIETGDGVATSYTKTSSTSVIKDNSGASHVVPGSLTISYRAAGVAVVAANARNRDDSANIPLVNATAAYEGRLATASIPTVDNKHDAVIRNTVSVIWNPDGVGDRTITVPVGTSSVVTTTPNGQGSVVTFDHKSSRFSVLFAGTDIPNGSAVGNIRVSFTPASATKVITSGTSVDGSGNITLTNASLTSGTLNVADGSYALTFTAGATNIPHNQAPLLATYKISAWGINCISGGVWGNDIKVSIRGSNNGFNASTVTFSKYNVFISLLDAGTNTFVNKETYRDVNFSSSTSAEAFAQVVNGVSKYISVVTPSAFEPVGELNGIAYSEILAGGDGSSGNRTISGTLLKALLSARTVSISYTDTTTTARTITDNGSGSLIGDVDLAYATTVSGLGPNKIDYTTGQFNFRTGFAIKGGTVVTISYILAPEETVHVEVLGDTAKDYSYTIGATTFQFYRAGSDGTFASGTYGRDQISNPNLESSQRGIYALNGIREILNIVTPDFVGISQIDSDILNYVQNRANVDLNPSGPDRFAIMSIPADSTAQEAVDYLVFSVAQNCDYAAYYWPQVKVPDPLQNNRLKTIPVIGHIAGVFARTETNSNVGKAPAGVIDGKLNFVSALEVNVSKADQDLVYPKSINPLHVSLTSGFAVNGAKTISSNAVYQNINAPRLEMFVSQSINITTESSIFSNNGPALWQKISVLLNGILQGFFARGFFRGATPLEAYEVICDETNNNNNTINEGVVKVLVKIAPNRPLEFLDVSLALQAS